jgi:hypothetical protein
MVMRRPQVKIEQQGRNASGGQLAEPTLGGVIEVQLDRVPHFANQPTTGC